jgi:fatty-acyl-CoA synthase
MSAVLSYSSGESATALLGDTIGGNFDATVRAFGGREALVDRAAGRRWTYAELAADVDALALGLLERGIGKGDRVGIWAPNCAEWTLTQYATAKIGAILVNINPAYRTRELEFVINQSGTQLLVAAEKVKTSDYAGMIAEVRPRCPALTDVVLLASPQWQSMLEDGRRLDRGALDRIELEIDDPINIQYTSGTTGFPKGATLSHHNILNNGFFVGELCNYTEADRICIPVPFYHCFGMVMGNLAATSHGACMVIPSPTFDPVATLEAVQAEHCTSLYGVPTMFIAELSAPGFDDYDLSSLRTGIMAGSPCPVEVMKQVIERMSMTEVGICYGMTETSPVSTQTRADDSLDRRVSTVGRVGPHLEATGSSRKRPPRRSIPRTGCTPATSRSWTTRGISPSPDGSRTWSSAAARTSTRGKSRSSYTLTPTYWMPRSSASRTSDTVRSYWPGCGSGPASRR